MHVPHMLWLSAAILFLQEWNQAEGKSWLWQHDVPTPPLHPRWLYRRGCLCPNVLRGGRWGLVYRVLFAGFPQNTLCPPLLLLLSLRDYYPAAPSKFLSVAARWRAHQQYLNTCWSSSAGRNAVIVERFCGFRLASSLFSPSILQFPREVSLMTIITVAGFICQCGQLEGFKKRAAGRKNWHGKHGTFCLGRFV